MSTVDKRTRYVVPSCTRYAALPLLYAYSYTAFLQVTRRTIGSTAVYIYDIRHNTQALNGIV